jgi:dienelactone hydrolase
MWLRRLQQDRVLASMVGTLAIVAVLVALWGLRQGDGWMSAAKPASKSTSVEIFVPAGGAATSARRRSYKVDVWVPARVEGTSSTPLIVYLTGWGSGRGDNTGLLGSLADAGYAVLALDDISQDAPYEDPRDEAARTATFDFSTDGHVRMLVEAAHRRAALQGEKISKLLDRLASDASLVPAFSPFRIDFKSVGVLGYSFGGATAAELGKRDKRVAAAVNIDGWQLTDSADQIAAFPLLMINSIEARCKPGDELLPDSPARHEAVLNRAENDRQILQVAARTDSYRLYLRSARHGDFSDHVLAKRRVLSWLKSGGQLITARATRRALDAMMLAFFDAHVRQLSNASVSKVISEHPDWIVLGLQQFR